MNKEETMEAIEVMQAFVEGEKIQYRPPFGINFQDFDIEDNPSWDWSCYQYRIKAATKPHINWGHVHSNYKWMATDSDGSTFLYTQEPVRGSTDWEKAGWEFMEAEAFQSFVQGDCDWKESIVERASEDGV